MALSVGYIVLYVWYDYIKVRVFPTPLATATAVTATTGIATTVIATAVIATVVTATGVTVTTVHLTLHCCRIPQPTSIFMTHGQGALSWYTTPSDTYPTCYLMPTII